jgi:4-hydroxy-2-oxoheptanedioate aldolase
MAYVNPFLARLAAGERLVGCWATTTETVFAEVMAHAGFDFVTVDLQHGSIELSTLAPVLQAVQAGGSNGIVRLSANDYRTIGKALDLGALAVVAPLVETVEEAASTVSACRYPPRGTRSWGAMRPNLLIGNEEPEELERFGCFVMIETVRGLENVEAIAAVEGLTGIFVGPADLAISLGMSTDPGAWSDEQRARHVAATDRILAACRRAGIAAGIFVGNAERARGYLDAGFQLVTASLDYGVLESGSIRDLEIARQGGRTPA